MVEPVKTEEQFGVVFAFGNPMGTVMIPIDLFASAYGVADKSQKVPSPIYSKNVKLVHYYLKKLNAQGENTLYGTPLSEVSCETYGHISSLDFFSDVMENDGKFNEVVDDLIGKYHEKTH